MSENNKKAPYPAERITRAGASWAGVHRIAYGETDSTNLRAREAAEEGACHGTVVTARSQTAGRGRHGRSWESPAGQNLYATLILRPELLPDRAPMLTLVMALSVCRTIRQLTELPCEIKWPNDIVYDGRKLCGILTQMQLEQTAIRYVLVGVGVNVDGTYCGDLAQTATSLKQACGSAAREELCGSAVGEEHCGIAPCLQMDDSDFTERLLDGILTAFEADYERFLETGDLSQLQEEYHAYLVNRNAKVRVLDPQGEYEGMALGITDTGELLVQTGSDICQVCAGEVSVRGIYGYV